MRKVLIPSTGGGHVLDLEMVAGCHWEKKDGRRRLVVHHLSGRVDLFDGEAADLLFGLISEDAVPVDRAGALQVR